MTTALPHIRSFGFSCRDAETLAGFYLPQGWKDVTPYIVLLIVLLIRPQGLFGRKALVWVELQKVLQQVKRVV